MRIVTCNREVHRNQKNNFAQNQCHQKKIPNLKFHRYVTHGFVFFRIPFDLLQIMHTKFMFENVVQL